MSVAFVLLGARNSGKTTYLTLLHVQEPSISANNAQTLSYLKDESVFLEKGRPHPTRMIFQELSFLYHDHSSKFSFSIQDYDGYFAESLSASDQADDYRERLKQSIQQAQGLLFFFPYESSFDPETFANLRHELNTFIQTINSLYPDQTQLPIPVVIGVTKWDRSPYFQDESERDHALAYLDSIPFFRHTKRRIDHFFAYVEVTPMACFDSSATLAPYNLTKPFDFFIESNADFLLKRIQTLKESRNPEQLYALLRQAETSPYRGRLETLLPLESILLESEAEYYQALRRQLVAEPDESARLLSRSLPLRSPAHRAALDALVRKNERKKRGARILQGLTLLIVLGGIGGGLFSFLWFREESRAYSDAAAESGSIERRLIRLQAYLETYDPLSMPETFFEIVRGLASRHAFLSHRYDILTAEASAAFFQELETLKTTSISVDEVGKAYRSLDDLRQRTRGLSLGKFLQALDEFESRLLIQEEEARTLSRLVAQVEASLEGDSRDISWLEEALNQLESFHLRRSLFRPPAGLEGVIAAIPDRIQRIKREQAQQRKQRLLTQARGFLTANVANIDALQALLENLSPFLDDPETRVISDRLSERLETAERDRRFRGLYESLLGLHNLGEMRTLIETTWVDFTPDQRGRLHVLLDGKISGLEFEKIERLPQMMFTLSQLEQTESLLSDLTAAQTDIPEIEYRYQGRTQAQTERIERAREKATEYRQALTHGFVVEAIRLTIDNNHNPLGLYCPTKGRSEGRLVFDRIAFDQESARCEFRSSKHIMEWESGRLISVGRYSLEIRERDTFFSGGDEILESVIDLERKHIFQFFNTGVIHFLLPEKYELSLLAKR